MEIKRPKSERRMLILINFISLALLVVIFELIKSGYFTHKHLFFEIVPLAILIFTYVQVFLRNGLWNFTHKSLSKLDEREMVLTNYSLRKAYSFFTISVLSLFVCYSLFNIQANMVLIVSLIYLAHILPAYIIGWTAQKIVEDD